MSRTFTVVKVPVKFESTVFSNQITINPGEDQIIFHGNTPHCYKGLVTIFNIALNAGNDTNGVKPNYTVNENDQTKTLTIQGDSEYVVRMCKRIGMFDEKSADDMLEYLSNPNPSSSKCNIL